MRALKANNNQDKTDRTTAGFPTRAAGAVRRLATLGVGRATYKSDINATNASRKRRKNLISIYANLGSFLEDYYIERAMTAGSRARL